MTDTPDEPAASAKDREPTVGRSGGIMVFSLTLSRVLGLLRDTVIASRFGLLAVNDSYRIAVQIPDLIFMLIAGGGLSSAFIPIFAELWHKEKKEDAWRVFSVVVTLCTLVASTLVLIAWVAAPAIVHFIGQGHSESVMPDAILMSRIMLPAQIAFLVGSVLLATLYSRRQFLAPGLAPNVYNLGIIVGAAVLPGIFGFGIIGVAWGALAGAFIGNVVLPIVAMARLGSRFKPSLDFRVPGVSKFFKLLLPVIFGFSLPSMVTLVTQKFASAYGEGANTALSYANNLMQAPNGIFGQSLALAVFPVLAQFFAQERMDLYRDQLSKTFRTVIFLSVPSSVLMYVLAPQIVHVIYGYGKGNDPHQLAVIAGCLRIYSFGIVAWCLQPVLMRGFFSLQKTFKPIALGTAMTALFVVECVLLQGSSIGIAGLPWATNLAAILLVLILYFALEMEVGKLDRKGIFGTLGKTVLAGVAMVPVAWVGQLLLAHTSGKIVEAGAVAGLSLASCWAFYLAARALKMPETEYLDRAIKRINSRRRPISESEAGQP